MRKIHCTKYTYINILVKFPLANCSIIIEFNYSFNNKKISSTDYNTHSKREGE